MKTNNIKEDNIIRLMAVIGAASIVALATLGTIFWIDPMFSTILGRVFVFGLYAVEALLSVFVLWLFIVALWKMFTLPRKIRRGIIKNIPLESARKITRN